MICNLYPNEFDTLEILLSNDIYWKKPEIENHDELDYVYDISTDTENFMLSNGLIVMDVSWIDAVVTSV